MNYTLIYDAGTLSRTPWRAVVLAGGLTALAVGVWVWNRIQGEEPGVFAFWATLAAVLIWLVAGATEYEKRLIARKDPLHVEGQVHSVWHDRTRRSRKQNDYHLWEGFSIGAIAFAYVRNVDTNYFNNAGEHSIDLAAGPLVLRVHYLEKHKRDRVIRYIVRVERLGPT